MTWPRPVVALLWRTHRTNRRLRVELDETKAALAVARCRETRWRRHATFASEGNPEAEQRVAFQLWSDEWADAPEIEDHQRNTFPRSIP